MVPVNAALPVSHLPLLVLGAALSSLPLMHLAVDHGASLDDVPPGVTPETALTACIATRFLPGVRFLLDKGASARKSNVKGQSPVYVLCSAPYRVQVAHDGEAGGGGGGGVPASSTGGGPGTPVPQGGPRAPPGGATPLPGTPGPGGAGPAPPVEDSDDDFAFFQEVLALLKAHGAVMESVPSPVAACVKRGSVRVLRGWLQARLSVSPAVSIMAAAAVALADAISIRHWAVAEALLDAKAPLQGVRRSEATCRAVRGCMGGWVGVHVCSGLGVWCVCVSGGGVSEFPPPHAHTVPVRMVDMEAVASVCMGWGGGKA